MNTLHGYTEQELSEVMAAAFRESDLDQDGKLSRGEFEVRCALSLT